LEFIPSHPESEIEPLYPVFKGTLLRGEAEKQRSREEQIQKQIQKQRNG
jgi:hypothetical protein